MKTLLFKTGFIAAYGNPGAVQYLFFLCFFLAKLLLFTTHVFLPCCEAKRRVAFLFIFFAR